MRGTCDKSRLLDLVENFTLFSEHKAGLVKIIGQIHQFLGVNNAVASMLRVRPTVGGTSYTSPTFIPVPTIPTSGGILGTRPSENGIGVFWQTQASGKSFSMVFFAQKVLRKVAGNWTFMVVTGRVELDDQIAKAFKATGAVSEAEGDQWRGRPFEFNQAVLLEDVSGEEQVRPVIGIRPFEALVRVFPDDALKLLVAGHQAALRAEHPEAVLEGMGKGGVEC